MAAYEKYIVCINKTPEDFKDTLNSLLSKAIKAYQGRGPELRHGIALDKQVTVILSQSETPRPICGIYFNLHSPYQRQLQGQKPLPRTEPVADKQSKSEA